MPNQISTVDGGALRQLMGRKEWAAPQPFGPDGWYMDRRDGGARIIVTAGPIDDSGEDWIHASISRPDQLPSYEDLKQLHRAVWRGTGWAYQVFAPTSHHVNIHEYALHLWGRPDGSAVLPEIGADGSI
jgi:hypothetical protein